MTEDIQKYSLFIKNSKFFFGRILKRDSKTRNVELELNNQKKTICKIKDLILEVSLANSPVTNNNIELSDLWSDLSNKTQIISTNEFINFALNKYEISNYFDLYNLVEKLNIDYTFFKILNSGNYLSDYDLNNNADYKELTRFISNKALRYDLTVPLARYISQNINNISFPFKRYQMQNVWRADKPQKGRFREFMQCDADIIGSKNLINEYELIRI